MVPNKQKTCQSAICSLKFLSRVSSLIKNSHCAHTQWPKRAIERFSRDQKSLRSPFLVNRVCALPAFLTHTAQYACSHAKCLPAFFILKSPSDSLSDTHVQTLVQIWTKRSRLFRFAMHKRRLLVLYRLQCGVDVWHSECHVLRLRELSERNVLAVFSQCSSVVVYDDVSWAARILAATLVA
jgi:hypothetical protein